MRWMGAYLIGYILFIGGVVAALWKSGIIERVGTTWTVIGLLIAIGGGIMLAVSHSGAKETVDIRRS